MLTEEGLVSACDKGDVARVKFLLSSDNVDVNGRSEYYSPLHAACMKGNIEIVELLLALEGIDVNYGVHRYTDSCTPLFAAYTRGFRDIVKLLLTIDGIDVNRGCYMMSHSRQYYDKTDTPLYYACKIGDYEIVKLLLKFKYIEVNMTISNYDEPSYGSDIFVHSTLEHDDSDHHKYTTPLYAACKRGYLNIAKLLLEDSNADINEGTVSPLYAAIKENFIDIIEYLLLKGAIVDENCKEAAEEMNIDIEHFLLHRTISLFKARDRSVLDKPLLGGDIYIQTSSMTEP